MATLTHIFKATLHGGREAEEGKKKISLLRQKPMENHRDVKSEQLIGSHLFTKNPKKYRSIIGKMLHVSSEIISV